MSTKSAVILVSDNPKRIAECLNHIKQQTKPFNRIVILPWKEETRQEVTDVALGLIHTVEIVEPGSDTRLESNRNKAIEHLMRNPPKWVSFLDDDTLIDKDWHKNMLACAIKNNGRYSFATVTRYISNPLTIQSTGHFFKKTRPLDLNYNKPLDSAVKNGCISTDTKPFCPCGNSAFVPWSAIKAIWDKDKQVWDPDFDQWMTCFDFGIKLWLVGYECKLAHKAYASHDGYLDNSSKSKLDCNQVRKQLRSRFLLYGKFFQPDEYLYAIGILDESLKNKLIKKEVYTHARDHIRGVVISDLYLQARSEAIDLLNNKPSKWRNVPGSPDKDCRKAIFGIS